MQSTFHGAHDSVRHVDFVEVVLHSAFRKHRAVIVCNDKASTVTRLSNRRNVALLRDLNLNSYKKQRMMQSYGLFNLIFLEAPTHTHSSTADREGLYTCKKV